MISTPIIDASPTIHEPLRTFTKPTGFPSVLPSPLRADLVAMPLVASTVAVYEPERLLTQEIVPALIVASPTLHAPSNVHRTLPVPSLDASAAVHEPVQVYQTLPLPSISAATVVYGPEIVATATAAVPLVDNTITVREPTANYTYTATIDTVIAATAIYEPVALNTTILEAPAVPSGHAVHEPTATAPYTISLDAVTSATFVYTPSQSATTPVFPPLVAETATYEPTLEATATVTVPTIPATVTVRQCEVIKQANVVEPPAVASTYTIFEPEASTTVDVPIGLLDASATFPEVTVTTGQVEIVVPATPSATAVYEPGFSLEARIAPEPLTAGVVHEPVTASAYPVTAGHVASTIQLYEPALHRSIPTPLVGPGTVVFDPGPYLTIPAPHLAPATVVHEPATASVVSADKLAATVTIHAPGVQKGVNPALLDSAATIHEPALAATITAPVDHLYTPATIYPPGFEQYAYILPTVLLGADVHAPDVTPVAWNVTLDALTATTDVLEPTLTASATIDPPIVSGASIHAPTTRIFAYASHITATTVVHEPTATPQAAFIAPETLNETAVYVPGIPETGLIDAPQTIDVSPTVHLPTIATGQVAIEAPRAASGAIIHEPAATHVYTIALDAITETTLHEPTFAYLVDTPTIAATVVNEPVVQATSTTVPGFIASTATLHEPGFALSSAREIPLLSTTATVHSPTATPQAATIGPSFFGQSTIHEPALDGTYKVEPFTVEFGWVYEPALDTAITIQPETVAALVGVYPPSTGHSVIIPIVDVAVTPASLVVHATIDAPIPNIATSHTVHEPVTYFYMPVTPETVSGTVLHAPNINHALHVAAIPAVSVAHGPNVAQTVHAEFFGPLAIVEKPGLVAVVSAQSVDASVSVYEPVAYDYYPMPVPPVAAATVIHNPEIVAIAYLSLEALNVSSVYTPTLVSGGDIGPPVVGISATPHAPTVEATYLVTVDATIEPVGVHEPELSPKHFVNIPETVESAASVHEPAVDFHNTIEPETLTIGAVHEPVAHISSTITVETIDATPTVYDVTQIAQQIPMPVVEIGTVHPFENLSLFVNAPTIENAHTVHEPATDFTYPISLEVVPATVEVFAPANIGRTAEMPHIAPGKEIHEPAVDFYNTITSDTIESPQPHAPSITTGEVYAQIPTILPETTIYEPKAIGFVNTPFVVGTTAVYGPVCKLFAPLEIIQFSLAIHQEALFRIG